MTTVTLMPAAAVIALFKEGNVDVVDVREEHEHAQTHIPGARNLPLSSFDPQAFESVPGKQTVLHCASGVRCGRAAALLEDAGFAGDLIRLEGGIMAWMQAGGPVEL